MDLPLPVTAHHPTRPINSSATIKCNKDTTWHGYKDWKSYIVRAGELVFELDKDPNCYIT